MQASRSQKGHVIAIGISDLFGGKVMLECISSRLTVSCTSFSVATSTTTAKVGGSCSLSRSVATRNSAEPGNTIAAPGDKQGPSSSVMLEYARAKAMRSEAAIATGRTTELVSSGILLEGKTKQSRGGGSKLFGRLTT